MNWYVTFGQWHPLRDHWIQIIAKDEDTARRAAHSMFGIRFGTVYSQGTFRPQFFPEGLAGYPVDADDVLN